MDLRRIPFFEAVHQRLGWLEQRQAVLAHNVANADTPNYRPSDLKPLSFQEMIKKPDTRLQVATTQLGHLSGPGGGNGSQYRANEARRTFESAPDGNAVVLEEQLAKVDQTKFAHKLANELYRKHLTFFRLAAGSR